MGGKKKNLKCNNRLNFPEMEFNTAALSSVF